MTSPVDPSSCTLEVLSSEELACRAQAGSLPSFAKLVERYQGRLYNFLLRRVGHTDDAEDLAQDTFIRAWERIDRYRTTWRFSTWLFTIGSRLAINHYRARKRGGRRELGGEALTHLESSRHDAEPSTDMQDVSNCIWSVAASLLSPDQHTMMWLRYAEDLTAPEIARVMGRTQVAVRVSLHRARERIAAALPELGAGPQATPSQDRAAEPFSDSPRTSTNPGGAP